MALLRYIFVQSYIIQSHSIVCILHTILWHMYVIHKIYSTHIILVIFMDAIRMGKFLKKEGLILAHNSRNFGLPRLERFGFRSLLCLVILLHPSGNRERMLVSSYFSSV